jgi:hypothetical protein
MPSTNDDVPAHDAEGRTSFYAEKTAQSLYAQLGVQTPYIPAKNHRRENIILKHVKGEPTKDKWRRCFNTTTQTQIRGEVGRTKLGPARLGQWRWPDSDDGAGPRCLSTES